MMMMSPYVEQDLFFKEMIQSSISVQASLKTGGGGGGGGG